MIDIQVFDNTENIDLKVAPASSIPVATETGFKGDQGDPGPPGPPGQDGRDGQDGSPGRDGEDGAPGRDGVDGAPGRDGVDGAPGRDGVDGEDGNGISSITKTGSATVDGRVVDTYTITFTDSTPTTFTVTNGKDGSGSVISVNGKDGAVVLTASDVGALPSTFTETDPTVPSWAKASTKPSYTAQEVGALPNTYTPPVTSVNGQTGAVSLSIPTVPTNVSAFNNDAGYITLGDIPDANGGSF